DLSSVINDLINMSNPRAKAKNLELKVLVDETMPHMLYGDDVRIKQCALNILTNGVKYTEEGSVTLEFAYERLSDDMMNLIITVKDTGIGIKEEDIEKLYSPFERIEESRNRTIEGTGLGMNIVKQLLDLMGSKLDVSSVYGVGSVFSFTIKQRIIKDEPIGDFERSYRKSIEDREKYQVQFRAPEAKILVVDDTALNLTVVKGLLKQTRVQIDTCESGFDALEMVRKNKYDCIFLDHRMPKMDGIETLQKMKEMDDNLNLKTPCVALTANAVSGARDVYMQAGFDDYISKPIDGTKLEHLLKTILPKELIYLPGDEGFDLNEVPLVTKKVSYDALDMKEAIQNCGSEELFVDVLKQYRDSIFDKADEIEKFYKERDYRNYTILVHALKSSSRLIGAIEISELAKELEAAGDREDSSFIEENTEKLLSMYRGLYEKIGGKEEEKRELDKPKISKEELDEIWGALKEMVEAFDFDSADGAYQALEEYLLPDEYQKLMPKLKKALLAVDREALLEILG
nr:response regulator [Lachnospiraceae bacterium]